MTKNSYFMRVLYLDEDEDKMNPILIKVPLTILSPSHNMLKLLVALEKFYGLECYLTIVDIEELPNEKIGIVPFGVITKEIMLVTTCFNDIQLLYGVTSSYGEYELLAIDKDGHYGAMVADQELANYLGLEYIEEVTNLHREYLESIDCVGDDEYVYYPSALYV